MLVADGPYDLRAVVTDTTGNVANKLLPGLPKTVDNTAPSGSVTSPAAASFVSGTVHVDATRDRRRRPARLRRLGRPLRGQAFRRRLVQRLRDADRSGRRLDLPAVARDDRLPGRPRRPPRRRHRRRRQRDDLGCRARSTFDNDAPVVTLDDPGAAVGATVTSAPSSSADTARRHLRALPAGRQLGAGTAIGVGLDPATVHRRLDDTPRRRAALRPARPSRPTAAATPPRAHRGRRGSTTRSRPARSPRRRAGAIVGGPAVRSPRPARTGGSGVRLVAFEVKAFGAGCSPPSAATPPRRTTATGTRPRRPDGDAEIRAIVTDAAGNVHTTAVVTVTVDSTGPSVTLDRSRRRPLRHGRAHREHERRRHARLVRRLPGRLRHVDGDRRRHELALRRRHSTRARWPTASTTCARSATTRSATRRRPPSARTSASTTRPRAWSRPTPPTDRSRPPPTRSCSPAASR